MERGPVMSKYTKWAQAQTDKQILFMTRPGLRGFPPGKTAACRIEKKRRGL